MTSSIAVAIASCIFIGSLPDTKIGSQPQPFKYMVSSLFGILAKTVGLAILYPFKCKIGKTAPSCLGLINLFSCQEVANGPVSASPSPMTQAAIKVGLSKIAPKA